MDKYHNRIHKIVGDIEEDLEKNIEKLEEIFADCSDVVKQRFAIENEAEIYIIYTDGLTDAALVRDFVLRPLIQESGSKGRIETADQKKVTTLEDAVTAVLSGNTMVFVDGMREGILISSKLFPTRGVQKAEEESTMIGPKDSFLESLRMNTALIRRRVRDSRMKVKSLQVGTRTKTDIAIMYIDDLVKPDILEEVKNKINNIFVDEILDAGMLGQYMEENHWTPFPSYQLTQRPDKTASGLLEGRIAIVVDNSPEVILLPATMNTFFQASDDYYYRQGVADFARILRYIGGFIAIGLPGLYIAVANWHPEVIPTTFLLALVSAREGVPCSVLTEVLMMEIAFELLREAGIRLPGQLGGTIGIVGGLIVGQAAVDAHIVSTIVVIVVAFTAIATFCAPNESFAGAFRLLKFFLIITSGLWGLYGFFLGFFAIFAHLYAMENFQIPYVYPKIWRTHDYLIRGSLEKMKYRPWFTKNHARKRRGD
ncbi:MAG: spore germination protein [Anaerostipes sp.]|nr:spore germination protein [Anaerostipes sp.]